MPPQRELVPYEVDILATIVARSIKSISYYHPKKQLGAIVKGKRPEETSKVLRVLAEEFGVLTLGAKPGFRLSNKMDWYEVNPEKARELFDAHVRGGYKNL